MRMFGPSAVPAKKVDKLATSQATSGRRALEAQLLFFPIMVALLGVLLFQISPRSGGGDYLGAALLSVAGFGAGLVAIHLILCARMPQADQMLLPLSATLISIGMIIIWRLTPVIELGPTDHFLKLAIALGVMAILLLWRKALLFWSNYKYLPVLIGIGLVAATLIAGQDLGQGIRQAIFFLQPSELLKLILVLFVAGYVDEYAHRLARLGLWTLAPLGIIWLAAFGLVVLQRDLGTALVFYAVFFLMMYLATGRGEWIPAGIALFVLLILLVMVIAPDALSTAASRATVWLDPWPLARAQGQQIVHGIYSMASGGLLGTGLGYGRPDTMFASHTDMVLVSISEELGLVGALAVLGIMGLLVYRCLHIALLARNTYNQLIAVGFAGVLGVQMLIIAGGSTKLVPLTGVTLPFVSYGGFSLLVSCAMIALLLHASASQAVRDDSVKTGTVNADGQLRRGKLQT